MCSLTAFLEAFDALLLGGHGTGSALATSGVLRVPQLPSCCAVAASAAIALAAEKAAVTARADSPPRLLHPRRPTPSVAPTSRTTTPRSSRASTRRFAKAGRTPASLASPGAPTANGAVACISTCWAVFRRSDELNGVCLGKDKPGSQDGRALVDKLLDSDKYVEEYARNWTTIWTNLLIGRPPAQRDRDD